MQIETAEVVGQQEVGQGGGSYLLALAAPGIAAQVRPGQFVHLRVPRLDGAVLRRPFSVYRAERGAISILYKTVGTGTAAMVGLHAGDSVSLMGPLGNGFPLEIPAGAVPLLVAGGYGMAPLWMLARSLPVRGAVFVGGASAKDILCVPEFEGLGWPVRIATEDGSRGERGLVTHVLDAWRAKEQGGRAAVFYACGPNGMLKAVGDRALAAEEKAWLSLDRHMGCGAGACLACVQKVRRDGTDMWARVCRDGPVFEAREIVWEG